MDLTFSLESLRKELQVVLTSDDMPSIPDEKDLEYKGEEQDNSTLYELVKRYPDKTYRDITQIQEDMRLTKEAKKAKDKIVKEDRGPLDLTLQLEKMEKRAQEAEGELSIMKGIETNRVKEKEKQITDLFNENDSLKDLIRSRDYTKAQDYKFLVEENKKLHKKIDDLIRGEEKRINKTREAGF